MKIEPTEITVVVQGPIDPNLTPLCLTSIREILPGATITLSTWKNSDVGQLDFDEVVFSADPGAPLIDQRGTRNNANRQIASTLAGLRTVKTPYALKLRSDMILTNRNFIEAFGAYRMHGNSTCRIFRDRVAINTCYAFHPRKTKNLFFMSDWVQFGWTEDVQKLWDIPPQSPADASGYFPVGATTCRYAPEQYIWISCLRKNGVQFEFTDARDFRPETLELSERSFADNFIILNYSDFGVSFLKYDPRVIDPTSLVSHYYWLKLYRKFHNPRLPITLIQTTTHLLRQLTEEVQKSIRRALKRLKRRKRLKAA